MARVGRPRLLSTTRQWLAALVCVSLGAALFTFVDLTPRLRTDFFFASDDPELQQTTAVERTFGYAPQIIIAARADPLVSERYLRRLRDLTRALTRVEGVTDVRSIAQGPETLEEIGRRQPADVFEDLRESPFWSRLLLAPDRSASFIIVTLGEGDQAATIDAIDVLVDQHDAPDFRLGVAGVPYVSEHIRRQLDRELRIFSLAAFAAFAILVLVIFRSIAILAGTMIAALTACFATFVIRAIFGMPTDILTPNLWTIAFVLTLSHVVYLAVEWRAEARRTGGADAIRHSIRHVGPASAWSLVANLLGFGSLLLVSAKPLREFGLSGAIAAVAAMACAYLIFPPFLASANPGKAAAAPAVSWLGRFFTTRHPWVAVVTLVAALSLAPVAWGVNTDPSLPSYFPSDHRVGQGIRDVDRSGGSSPLELVVRDAKGGRLDNDAAFDRMRALQRDLERHPDTGSVLSIALLMAETERPWYSFLFGWERKLEALDSPDRGRIGRAFLTKDRRQGRFLLRMRELARDRPRDEVIKEIEGIARRHGFEPALVAGLYPLQSALSDLVQGSVLRGLGGLMGLFAIIAFIVTRSVRIALAMAVSLAIPPLALFGFVGLARMPVDIISAPAANVALPLGIDEMIHLGYAVRRGRNGGDATWLVWQQALQRLWMPILSSMLIVASGFLLFLLSSFPPTRRLGILVCIGAALTDLVVLVVLPALATRRRARS